MQNLQIPIWGIIVFFLVKILAGCFYGYIHTQSVYYPDKIDTWRFYFESLPETDLLLKNPKLYLDHLLGNHYTTQSAFLHTYNNYWNDLKHNSMVGLMSIFNLFSGKNYYINIIFYNFIALFGCIAFYKFCMLYGKQSGKWFIVLALCIPSFIFWSSGFHKEGLLFTAISCILYSSYKISYGIKTLGYAFLFSISVLCILLLRSYLLLFLTPFLFTWVLMQYYPLKKAVWSYVVAAMVFVIAFFNIGKFVPSLNLPNYTCTAQQEFMYLGGTTAIPTDTLAPTASSFIKHLPHSVHTAFLQPNWKHLSITYIPTLLENFIFIGLCILALFFYARPVTNKNAAHLFFFFSIGGLLFLGYTVPVVGAIVRYKCIFLPFLFLAVSQYINWNRFLKHKE